MTTDAHVTAFMEASGFKYWEPKYTPSSSSWRKDGLSFTQEQATFMWRVSVEAEQRGKIDAYEEAAHLVEFEESSLREGSYKATFDKWAAQEKAELDLLLGKEQGER